MRISIKSLPESSKHKTSLSACFDTSNHTESVAIFEMDTFSHKEVGWEWVRVMVASQNVVGKGVRAFVMFHTGACAQIAIRSPYISMLAEKINS